MVRLGKVKSSQDTLSSVVGDVGQDDGRVNGDCGGVAVSLLKKQFGKVRLHLNIKLTLLYVPQFLIWRYRARQWKSEG